MHSIFVSKDQKEVTIYQNDIKTTIFGLTTFTDTNPTQIESKKCFSKKFHNTFTNNTYSLLINSSSYESILNNTNYLSIIIRNEMLNKEIFNININKMIIGDIVDFILYMNKNIMFITRTNQQFTIYNDKFEIVEIVEKYIIVDTNLIYIKLNTIYENFQKLCVVDHNLNNLILYSTGYIHNNKVYNFENKCIKVLNLENNIIDVIEHDQSLFIISGKKIVQFNKNVSIRNVLFDYSGDYSQILIENQLLYFVSNKMIIAYNLLSNTIINEVIIATEFIKHHFDNMPESSTDLLKFNAHTQEIILNSAIIIPQNCEIQGSVLIDNCFFCIGADRRIVCKFKLPRYNTCFIDKNHIILIDQNKISCYQIYNNCLVLLMKKRINKLLKNTAFDMCCYKDEKVFLYVKNKIYSLSQSGILTEVFS